MRSSFSMRDFGRFFARSLTAALTSCVANQWPKISRGRHTGIAAGAVAIRAKLDNNGSRGLRPCRSRGDAAMDLAMTGKKAIVTGASEGIGKAITLAFAREGVDVAICARRKEPLEATAAEITKATGAKIFAIPADLTKPADAENFIKKAHAALGRIDILVNNAGSSPGGVLEHLTEEDWAQSLQLKFMGYVRCMKHVLPIMRQQKKGRVVNLIGNDGVKVSYWEIAPGAANAAGQNLTLSLASQYGKDNISFVAVNPGPVRTERWA